MLRIKKYWKSIKTIAKMHNFQEFLKFDLNYETVMSFLIIGRKFVHVKAPMFPKALSTALKWMEMN
jgi:hypothetical protein